MSDILSVPGARVAQALNEAASSPAALSTARRRDDYTAASACACDVPNALFTSDRQQAICVACGSSLNIDTAGEAFRRWPGDINSAEIQLRELARRAEEDGRAIIRKLPKAQQARLERLANKDPQKFEAEARRIIAAHDAGTAEALKHPNTRRRMGRMRDSVADAIDSHIQRHAEQTPD